MPTLKDIAKLTGYSIGTVSRVLNHHPDVSAHAKEVIEKAVAETGFQPNTNAKMLKQTMMTDVTIIVKGTQNIFFEAILEEIQKTLRENGEEASVSFLDERANEVEEAIHLCSVRKPKGIIFLGGNPEYFKERFHEITIPCVMTGASAKELGFDNLSSFSTDDVEGAKAAVEYLIMKGHQHIGIVGGSMDARIGQIGVQRLYGALEMLEMKGIDIDLNMQYESSRFSLSSGYEAAKKLLEKDPAITGIFALGDMVAIGAMRAIYDSGKRIPDDISLIGYDGIAHTRYTVPRLATIQQDVATLARLSVEDLLMRMQYPRATKHESIPFKVLAGESIKDLRNKKQKKVEKTVDFRKRLR